MLELRQYHLEVEQDLRRIDLTISKHQISIQNSVTIYNVLEHVTDWEKKFTLKLTRVNNQKVQGNISKQQENGRELKNRQKVKMVYSLLKYISRLKMELLLFGLSFSLVAQIVKNMQCSRPGFDPWVGKIPWRREWQPTPVLLPGESHGQWNLAGYSPQDRKELDTTE